MRATRKRLAILAAAVFTAGVFMAADGAAQVLFDARVRTPVVSIRVGNALVGYRPAGPIRPLPYRGRMNRAIRHDVQVARRLAWYTGMPRGELLRYRRYGYTWYEIGQWLYVPGRVVRAAMSDRGWDRFLHAGGYHAMYDGGRGRGRRGDDRHRDRHRDDYGYRR